MSSGLRSSLPVDGADRTPAQGPYVEIQNLQVTFTGGRRPVQAVNGVDLRVQRGEVVALIGESGSGNFTQQTFVIPAPTALALLGFAGVLRVGRRR